MCNVCSSVHKLKKINFSHDPSTGVNFIKALMLKFAPENAKKDGVLTFQFHNTYWAVTTPKMGNKVVQNVLPKKWLFLAQISHAKLQNCKRFQISYFVHRHQNWQRKKNKNPIKIWISNFLNISKTHFTFDFDPHIRASFLATKLFLHWHFYAWRDKAITIRLYEINLAKTSVLNLL